MRDLMFSLIVVIGAATYASSEPAATQPASARPVAATQPARLMEPRQAGGEPDGIVQIANLVYAGTKSSRCCSDHFLVKAEKDSAISTSRRFHAVKLGSNDLFDFPMVIMTGEGTFALPEQERENLRKYCDNGGVVLASAGCSSQEWDRSFRQEMAMVFPGVSLDPIGMDHPIFHMVYEIPMLHAAHGQPRPLEAVAIGGRLAIIYSRDGLNDTANAHNCCCCGANEITNAIEVNVNILAYALMY
jgi:hypothetical protein